MKEFDRWPLVKVEWLDSTGVGRWGEIDIDTKGSVVIDHDQLKCISIGWLIHKCEKCVSLASSINHITDAAPHVYGELIIPRVAITRLTRLERKPTMASKKGKKKRPKKMMKPTRTKRRSTEKKGAQRDYEIRFGGPKIDGSGSLPGDF